MLKIVCLVALAAVAFGQDCNSCLTNRFSAVITSNTVENGCKAADVGCFGCSERIKIMSNYGSVLYEGPRMIKNEKGEKDQYTQHVICNGDGEWSAEDTKGRLVTFEKVVCENIGHCIDTA